MSKSTNTVVYFDWKTVIYIYACGKCRTQFMPLTDKLDFFHYCKKVIALFRQEALNIEELKSDDPMLPHGNT